MLKSGRMAYWLLREVMGFRISLIEHSQQNGKPFYVVIYDAFKDTVNNSVDTA
jgi:hypothetical protein